MKTKYLDKFLKNHTPTCTIHIYSNDNRKCSCGRDGAERELEVFIEAARLLININNWLSFHGALEPNSSAELKISEVAKKLEDMI